MRSKKLISIVSALAMILSLFSAFTVAQAADTAEITAEIIEAGTKVGENVKIKFAYKGLDEANSTLGAIGFCLPLDETVFDVANLKSETTTYTGAVMGWNSATKVYSFSYTTVAPTAATENELAIVTIPLLKDIELPYTFENLTEIILTSLNTTDYSEYTYADVSTPAITVGGGSTSDEEFDVTVTVKGNGSAEADVEKAKEGDTVTITYEADKNNVLKSIKVNGEAIDAENGKATFTMPGKAAKVVVTFEEEEEEPEILEYVIDPAKGDKGDLGQIYNITVSENADYVGTKHEEFDVVVSLFDGDNVAIGYMIFNDVTVDSDISVCLADADGYVAINVVDNFTADNMGTVLAEREIK